MRMKADVDSDNVVEGFTLPAKGTNGVVHIHTFRIGHDPVTGRMMGMTHLTDQSERHSHLVDLRGGEKMFTSGASRGIDHKHEFVLFKSPLQSPNAANPNANASVILDSLDEHVDDFRAKRLGYRSKRELVNTVKEMMKKSKEPDMKVNKQEDLEPVTNVLLMSEEAEGHNHEVHAIIDPERDMVWFATAKTSSGDQHVHILEAILSEGPSFTLESPIEGGDHTHIVQLSLEEAKALKGKLKVITLKAKEVQKSVGEEFLEHVGR